MGAVESNLLRQARNAGLPIPDRIKNKPRLIPGLEFFIDAFFELQTEVDMSQGLRAIPWSAIQRYAGYCGCDDEECEELVFFVRYLDNVHLQKASARLKTKTG